MRNGDHYRVKAFEFLELAGGISEEHFRRELINMAISYTRLADMTARNAEIDPVHDGPAASAAPPH